MPLPSQAPFLQHRFAPPNVPCVGRDRELARLRDLIDLQRWVSVIAPPGMGKSHLCREFARSLVEQAFVQGVIRIDLSKHGSASEIVQAVGAELGVATGNPEIVAALLGIAGSVVLFLDNADHVGDGSVPLLEEWLSLSSKLRVLLSTRSPFRSKMETHFRLEPLELPSDPDVFLESAAGTFFAATLARHDVFLSKTELPTAYQLVHEVEGVPLAIELLAKQSAFIGLEPALARWCEYKAGGSSDVMRVALSDCVASLSEEQRSVLRRCALFAAAFLIEDLQALCSEFRDKGIDSLQELVERGLVTRSGKRFQVLRILRDVVLSGAEDLGTLRSSFAVHIFGSLHRTLRSADPIEREAAEVNLKSIVHHSESPELAADAAQLLERMNSLRGFDSSTHDAIECSLRMQDKPPPALLIAFANSSRARGAFEDAERSLEQAGEAGPMCIADRAQWLLAHATNELARGRAQSARLLFEEAIATCGDETALRFFKACALARLGAALSGLGENDEATFCTSTALEIFTALGEQDGAASMATHLGIQSLDRGDHEIARRYLTEGLELHRAMRNPLGRSIAEANLGALEYLEGQFDAAKALYDRAIERFESIGARLYASCWKGFRGLLYVALGDFPRADRTFSDVVEDLTQIGDARYRAYFLACSAGVAAELGHLKTAERRLEAARMQVCGLPGDNKNLAAAISLLEVPLLRSKIRRKNETEGDDTAAIEQQLVAAFDRAAARDPRGMSVVQVSAETRMLLRWIEPLVPKLPASKVSHPADLHPRGTLVISGDGAWARTVHGDVVDFTSRRTLAKFLLALAQAHTQHPGRPLQHEALQAEVWPGERLIKSAVQSRIWVSMSVLRKLGFSDVIKTSRKGYFIDHEVPVVIMQT